MKSFFCSGVGSENLGITRFSAAGTEPTTQLNSSILITFDNSGASDAETLLVFTDAFRTRAFKRYAMWNVFPIFFIVIKTALNRVMF